MKAGRRNWILSAVSLLCVVLSAAQSHAADPALAGQWRKHMDLNGAGWKLWLDMEAKWQTDTLYVSPINIAELPVNPPTVGWEKLFGKPEGPTRDIKEVKVPGTVEEYFWGANHNLYGLAGHYQGVCWWWRDVAIPADWQGKKLILRFAACRQRTEVFVNEKLVGYDIVGNTPFDVDITAAAKAGETNRLAVRITDPDNSDVDNSFDWADHKAHRWGNSSQSVPGSHGFGGITGRVTLDGVDAGYVSDVYVKNKPSPSQDKPTDMDVDIELTNTKDAAAKGTLRLQIFSRGKPNETLYDQSWSDVAMEPGKTVVHKSISAPAAKLWDLETPNLYECEAAFDSKEAGRDAMAVTFGFRWFTADGVGTPNAVLRMNGKRVFVRTAVSWGFWGLTGLFPTEELAVRQTKVAKDFGLNMIYMHRTIPDPLLLEKADEMGLLIAGEPGGYKSEGGDAKARQMATEKLMRFVRRDRSHPSMVVWTMINEIWVRQNVVPDSFLKDMADAHMLDPARIITLVSGQQLDGRRDVRGSWMAPYETERREVGWWDEHRAGGPGVYLDSFYRGPKSYYGGDQGTPDVITCMSEQGAVSSPPLLDSMMRDYEKAGNKGWDGDDYARLQKNFGQWLDEHKGREAYPAVDDLCRALGNVALYQHGRLIESARAADRVDWYGINGWECTKMDNHSGIVDPLRNPKGDPAVLRYYLRPLYIAVKARRKVGEPGGDTICDFAIINEKDVKGDHTLEVVATDPNGQESFRKEYPVTVTGGDKLGQFLQENVTIPVGQGNGYTKIKARLLDAKKQVVTDGEDDIFVADYKHVPIPAGGLLIDTGGLLRRFLESVGYHPTAYDEAQGTAPFILVTDLPGTAGVTKNMDNILQRVKQDGSTLVLIHQPEQWAQMLKSKGAIEYDGVMPVGTAWTGGNYFALKSPLLTGLPQAVGMSWEYQVLCSGNQGSPGRRGLLLKGDEAAMGCYNSTDTRLGTVVGSVKYGAGHIIFSTLPIFTNLRKDDPTCALPKRLLVNLLAYGSGTAEPTSK